MKPKKPLTLHAFLLSLAFASISYAAVGTWSGGNATWDTSSTNWTGVSGTAWDGTNGITNTATFNTANAAVGVSGTVNTNVLNVSANTTFTDGTISMGGTIPAMTVSSGTTTLAGTNAITGGGTLTISTASAAPIFTYNSSASSTFGAILAGNGSSRTATLNQTAGTIIATTLTLGNGANSGGIVNLSGGSMILSSFAEVGKRAATNWVSQMNVSGTGSLSAASMTVAPNSFSNGDSAGHLQITGGSVTLTNNLVLGGSDTGRHSAYATLSGGTTTVASIVGGNGASTNKFLYFNGGVLRPQADSANFISGLNGAYVYGGGAVIDTTDKTITIGQNLLGTSGTGVRSITGGTYGSGFTPSTTLLVTLETPSGGRPATAWVTTNASGQINGIVSVVDQGTGYSGSGTLTATAGAGTATGIPVTYGLPNLSGGTGITTTGGGLTKRGGGTLTLSGTNSYTGDTSVNNGSVTVSGNQSAANGSWILRGYGDSGSTFNTVATTTTFGVGSTISVASGKTVQLGNNVASGGFQTQTLNANGSATNAGTLFVGRSGIFNIGGTWVQNGAATVGTQGGGAAAMSVTSGGSFTYGSGTEFQINSTGSTNTNTNLTINGGLLTTGVKFHNAFATAATGSSSGIILGGGGTLKLSANIGDLFTTAGATNRFVLDSGNGIIDTSEFSTTLNVPISGAGSLTKQGAGALTLSGTNTYQGNTSVSSGKLVINGSISTSLLTTVDAAGTLTGTGTVGAATINGTLAPGDGGIETLDFSGDLTLAGTSAFEINAAANTSDMAISAALLTFGGSLNVTNIAGTLANGQTFDLFNWASSTGTFSSVSLPSLTGGLAWDQSQLYTNGIITVVPEPRAAMLGLCGALIWLRRRRNS